MKFIAKNALSIAWDDFKGKAYNSKDDFANASAASFEVGPKGHGKVKTLVSDRVYYVLEGSGEFEIDGEITTVSTTDVVIIPKNTPYDYRANKGTTLKLFLVHTPAFDPKKEVKL